MLISIGVSEVDLEERSTSSWVVEDRSDNSLDVALPLCVVEVAISGGGDSLGLGGPVDASWLALPLA